MKVCTFIGWNMLFPSGCSPMIHAAVHALESAITPPPKGYRTESYRHVLLCDIKYIKPEMPPGYCNENTARRSKA